MDGKCGLREGSKRLGKDGSKGIIIKRRIKKARKRWVKGYNKHSTKPRVALSFYRVRKTDGEAYIANIDYIRKMAYHFAASAGQETAFFTAT